MDVKKVLILQQADLDFVNEKPHILVPTESMLMFREVLKMDTFFSLPVSVLHDIQGHASAIIEEARPELKGGEGAGPDGEHSSRSN